MDSVLNVSFRPLCLSRSILHGPLLFDIFKVGENARWFPKDIAIWKPMQCSSQQQSGPCHKDSNSVEKAILNL